MKFVQKKQINIMIALCISVLFVTIFSIHVYNQKNILTSYYPTTDTVVYDMKIEDLKIEKDWLKSYHLLSSLLLISSERIFMFECKENYKDQIILKVHEYVDALKSQFKNSKELALISNYQEYIKDDFYILIISNKADKIMKEIKKRIS